MPETDKALAALAQKLGVSVDHLWAALLAQQRIEGLFLLVLVGACGLACLVAYVMICNDDSDIQAGGIFIGLVGFVAMWPIGYWALTDLYNPAYAALYDLRGLLK